MKFGKSIRAEARNNRGLSFVNFKFLKRLLKRCTSAASTGAWALAQEEDARFREVLEAELKKVGESVYRELDQISSLQEVIQERLALLDLSPDPETFDGMTFEELQSHLQSLGGLVEIPAEGSTTLPTSVKTSAALCDFCVTLGKVSSRCKRLRRCVLWNAVAIVKILKKRQKCTTEETLQHLPTLNQTAAEILSSQDWYTCPSLSQIVSMVETTTDELMQRLTNRPPNRERYQCPICLDVVVDPVCLKTCGHRFCWACLCMAYCEKPGGTLERCPCCRAAFPLDPEAFEIDGILSRFLRNFFPDQQSRRVAEQKEYLRQRLAGLSNQNPSTTNNNNNNNNRSLVVRSDNDSKLCSVVAGSKKLRADVAINASSTHCCPDCVSRSHKSQPTMQSSSNTTTTQTSPTSMTTALYDELALLPAGLLCSADIATSLTPPWSSYKIESISPALCRHSANVREGRPAGVDSLGYSGRQRSSMCPSTTDQPIADLSLSTTISSISVGSLSSSTSCTTMIKQISYEEEKYSLVKDQSSYPPSPSDTSSHVEDASPVANNGIVRMMLLHLDDHNNEKSNPSTTLGDIQLNKETRVISNNSSLDFSSKLSSFVVSHAPLSHDDISSDGTTTSSSYCGAAQKLQSKTLKSEPSHIFDHHHPSLRLPDILSIFNLEAGRSSSCSVSSHPSHSAEVVSHVVSPVSGLSDPHTKADSKPVDDISRCWNHETYDTIDDDDYYRHVYETVDADDDAMEDEFLSCQSRLQQQQTLLSLI